MRQGEFLEIVKIAFDAIARRSFALIALFMAGAMWGYTVWEPTTERIWACALFSALVYIPTAWPRLPKDTEDAQ